MKKTDITSYIFVKLLVVLVIDAVAVVSALFFRILLVNFTVEGLSEAEAARVSNIILSILSACAFFLYSFYIVYKMDAPEKAKKPIVSSLTEIIPYVIFLLPLIICYYAGYDVNMLASALGYVYAPHIAPWLLGLPITASAAIFVLIYFAVNVAAYIANAKKPKTEDPKPAFRGYMSYDEVETSDSEADHGESDSPDGAVEEDSEKDA